MKLYTVLFCFLSTQVLANLNPRLEAVTPKVDILLVMDNSGSMSTIHNLINSNIKSFYNVLTGVHSLDWKLGLISTDINDKPFLGFNEVFNSKTKNKVESFGDAMGHLGTAGSSTEVSYDNVIKALINSPRFSRAQRKSNLVVIFVTDEKEQSTLFSTQLLLTNLSHFYGSYDRITMYGIFDYEDMENCTHRYQNETYKWSRFEEAIVLTKGFAISACTRFFEHDFISIARDVAKKSLK